MKNNRVKILGWLSATIAVTYFAAWLIHPAVVLGVIIGVTMTTLKYLHCGD